MRAADPRRLISPTEAHFEPVGLMRQRRSRHASNKEPGSNTSGTEQKKTEIKTSEWSQTEDRGSVPTFLHCGVELGDFDGQLVHALLQAAHPQVEAVGFIEELAEDVLSMATCTQTCTWLSIFHPSIFHTLTQWQFEEFRVCSTLDFECSCGQNH